MSSAVLSVEALRRIEAVCTRFEKASPEARDIELWLGETTGHERSCLRRELMLLKDELEADLDVHTGSMPGASRYRFLEPIGRGGVGTVWRVLDTKTQRHLAIKLLNESLRHAPAALARLHREALLTGSLQHPGIPPVHDYDLLEDGRAFFSMKLVEGVTLAKQLSCRAQSSPSGDGVGDLLGTFEQVAQVLAYAHANGVIHRDVKPHNIMVGKFGEVQLMDWGMAKRVNQDAIRPPADRCSTANAPTLDESTPDDDETISRWDDSSWPEDAKLGVRHRSASLTTDGDIMGTPAYMAPEQARGEVGSVDARSDVFGLGAILYEILAGRRLYDASDSTQVLVQAAAADHTEPFERLDRVVGSETLKGLCRTCLQPDRERRPRDAGVVADAVAAHLSSVQEQLQQVEAERQAAVFQALAESKQRKTMAAMTVLVAMVLTLGIVGIAWQWRQAVAARQRTAAALTLADQRFQQAQQIVDEYLSEVANSESVLAKTPGAEEMRRQLLQKAKDYYEHFVAEAGEDPAVLYAAASAYERLGRIEQVLYPGSDDAIALYRRAVDLLEGSNPAGRQNRNVTRDIAHLHDQIGKVYLSTEQFVKANESFSRSVELFRDIIDRSQGDWRDTLSMAKATHNLALSMDKQGRTSQSQQLFEEALAFALPLLESEPDDADLLLNVGNMYSNAGMQYGFKLRDWERSLEYTRQSLDVRQHLVAVHPGDHRYEDALAVSHNNIGLALYQAKRIDESRAAFERAAQIREQLIRDHPSVPQYSKQLARTYSNLGTFSVKQGMPEEAIANYERCVRLSLRDATDHPQILDHVRSAIDALVSIAAIDPRSDRARSAIKQLVVVYEQVLTVRPDSIPYSVNCALFSALSPEADAAELLRLTDAITLQNESVKPRYRATRALALCRAGMALQALDHLQLIEPAKRDSLAWGITAIVQYHLNDFEEARVSVKKARGRLKKKYPDYADLVLVEQAEQLLAVQLSRH